MTVFGYWRCSTDTQDQERQIRALEEANVEKIYGDKITGTSDYGDREQLSQCLDELQEGDLLILEDLTRLGRTMVTMLVEVNKLIERNVFIKTLDGRLDTSLMNDEIVRLIVGVMGYASECELRNIKHRTSEGRAVAKSRGVKFGRKRQYKPAQAATVLEMRQKGDGYGTIASSMGMSIGMVRRIIQNEASQVGIGVVQ
tara:strand:- start:2644 stop:3240 length:597 start_codon:yes stop_codon:yes gene_type:complete